MSPSTATNVDQPTIVYGSGRKPDAAIPRPGLNLQTGRVAVVVTDPQNDFLSPQGVSWSVVGHSIGRRPAHVRTTTSEFRKSHDLPMQATSQGKTSNEQIRKRRRLHCRRQSDPNGKGFPNFL